MEGLEIILSQVLIAFLTLITVVPLFALLQLPSPTYELVVGTIVFAAWFVAVTAIAPLFPRRWIP